MTPPPPWKFSENSSTSANPIIPTGMESVNIHHCSVGTATSLRFDHKAFTLDHVTGMESGGESSGDEEGVGGGAQVGKQYLRWNIWLKLLSSSQA